MDFGFGRPTSAVAEVLCQRLVKSLNWPITPMPGGVVRNFKGRVTLNLSFLAYDPWDKKPVVGTVKKVMVWSNTTKNCPAGHI